MHGTNDVETHIFLFANILISNLTVFNKKTDEFVSRVPIAQLVRV